MIDDGLDDDHVSSCLQCQAEVVRGRRIRRMLGSLRRREVTPVGGLLDDILSALDDPVTSPPHFSPGRRTACAVAAAVGAAGTVVLANRARSRWLAG